MRPQEREEGIVTGRIVWRLFGVGTILAAGTLGMFFWTIRSTGDIAAAQSVASWQ